MVSFDVASWAEDHIHRVGRTGRAGISDTSTDEDKVADLSLDGKNVTNDSNLSVASAYVGPGAIQAAPWGP